MMGHLKMRAIPLQTKRKSQMKMSRVSLSVCLYAGGTCSGEVRTGGGGGERGREREIIDSFQEYISRTLDSFILSLFLSLLQ